MSPAAVTTVYEKPPSFRFRLRLLLLLSPLLWVTFLAVGIAGYSRLNPLPPTSHVDRENPTAVTMAFYGNYLAAWANAPDGCVHGQMQSDFQRERCAQFWERIAQASAIAIAPFIVFWLGYLFGMDALRSNYRRVRKKIESKQAFGRGLVGKPAVLSNDFFGWLYGFRSGNVQLERAAPMRVYFSRRDRAPAPGDAVAVFAIGGSLGSRRYFGIYYSPHVAVISSVTRK